MESFIGNVDRNLIENTSDKGRPSNLMHSCRPLLKFLIKISNIAPGTAAASL